MKKRVGINPNQVIIACLVIAWVIGFVLYQNSDKIGEHYWYAFAFGLAGLVLAEGFLVFRKKANRSTVEVSALAIVFTVIFVVIMSMANIGYAVVQAENVYPIFIIGNIVVIAAYIVIEYNINKYLLRVNKLSDYVSDKTRGVMYISQQLAILISVCSDAELKRALINLKEKVDFSGNVSQSFSEDLENNLKEQLEEIQKDLSSGASNDIVREKIQKASLSWDMRNSKVNSIK